MAADDAADSGGAGPLPQPKPRLRAQAGREQSLLLH